MPCPSFGQCKLNRNVPRSRTWHAPPASGNPALHFKLNMDNYASRIRGLSQFVRDNSDRNSWPHLPRAAPAETAANTTPTRATPAISAATACCGPIPSPPLRASRARLARRSTSIIRAFAASATPNSLGHNRRRRAKTGAAPPSANSSRWRASSWCAPSFSSWCARLFSPCRRAAERNDVRGTILNAFFSMIGLRRLEIASEKTNLWH